MWPEGTNTGVQFAYCTKLQTLVVALSDVGAATSRATKQQRRREELSIKSRHNSTKKDEDGDS